MRTDIRFELKCAKCGDLLEADNKSEMNKIEGNSAWHYGVAMAVSPCARCLNRAEKPGKLLREALDLINKEGEPKP